MLQQIKKMSILFLFYHVYEIRFIVFDKGLCLTSSLERCMADILIALLHYTLTAAVAQWVRAFALQAEGCVFESQPRQT